MDGRREGRDYIEIVRQKLSLGDRNDGDTWQSIATCLADDLALVVRRLDYAYNQHRKLREEMTQIKSKFDALGDIIDELRATP